MKKFVPDDFEIPMGFMSSEIKARPITIDDAVKDYDAVMSSISHLHGIFGNDTPWAGWPTSELSLKQDIIDLAWHQKEFQDRRSFTYTVMSPDESAYLGCFYIFPYDQDEYDAIVYIWVRKSGFDKGLDPVLEKEVRKFMEPWPFKKILYFGRK